MFHNNEMVKAENINQSVRSSLEAAGAQCSVHPILQMDTKLRTTKLILMIVQFVIEYYINIVASSNPH